jgi:CBS domain-containing protein
MLEDFLSDVKSPARTYNLPFGGAMDLEEMERMPPMAAVMTPFPYSIGLDSSLRRARRVMAEHRIHHLPVTAGGDVVGMLSASQLPPVGDGGTTVRDLTLGEPSLAQTTDRLDVVLERMAAERVETVVVVKGRKLAGIFTTSDACRRFVEVLRQLFPPRGNDAA